MKKFSQFHNKLTESYVTADINPGNALSNTGVTNHYTPIENILLTVKNLFSTTMGIVASVGEDGMSIKLNCSRFVNPDDVYDIIYSTGIYRNQSLANYIISQGLPIIKLVNIGQYYIVYFEPDDIAGAGVPSPQEPVEDAAKAVTEMQTYGIAEAELSNLIKENDEEIEDVNKKQIKELIDSKDKVKAAKQIELLVGKEMELPRDYYFAGVKSSEGKESIALRWRRMVKRPGGTSSTVTYSLLNIFDSGDNGIWVPSYAEDSIFNLPDEVKKLIKNVLNNVLMAEKTKDPAVYTLSDKKHKDMDDDKSDKDKSDKEDETDPDEKEVDKDKIDKKNDDDSDSLL